mgnify:CR=1 FL=1
MKNLTTLETNGENKWVTPVNFVIESLVHYLVYKPILIYFIEEKTMNKSCIVCGMDIKEIMSRVCSIKCFDKWVDLNKWFQHL